MLHEDNKSFLLVDVIGTYAITLGFFCGIGYFLYNYVTKQLKSAGYVSSKKSRSTTAASGPSSLADDAEWTEGMNMYTGSKNKKTKKKKKRN